jgi:hypothetical protein
MSQQEGGYSGTESACNWKRNIMLAKVSLVIVFVFIVCHSIKWIPNIYELIQVRISFLIL